MSRTPYGTRSRYDAMLPASPRLRSLPTVTTPARVLAAPPGNDKKQSKWRTTPLSSKQRDVSFFFFFQLPPTCGPCMARDTVRPTTVTARHRTSWHNFALSRVAPYSIYSASTARDFTVGHQYCHHRYLATSSASTAVPSRHHGSLPHYRLDSAFHQSTMGKSARYKPLRSDVRPGSRLYSYGGRYPDRFCTLVRLTKSKMVVAIDDDDVDERCVNRESFTDAANAPIPDPASQSVPAVVAPAPPSPAPIQPSAPSHGSAYHDPSLPQPPTPTDSLVVRGSRIPVCELIEKEPVLYHRFLLCCTSFAAAGVNPGTGFPAFLQHVNMAPPPPSAVVPRTGPPVATSRLPSPPSPGSGHSPHLSTSDTTDSIPSLPCTSQCLPACSRSPQARPIPSPRFPLQSSNSNRRGIVRYYGYLAYIVSDPLCYRFGSHGRCLSFACSRTRRV